MEDLRCKECGQLRYNDPDQDINEVVGVDATVEYFLKKLSERLYESINSLEVINCEGTITDLLSKERVLEEVHNLRNY